MATDDAIILRAAAVGSSIRDIAAERGLSEDAVTAILDREAAAWFDGKHLRRELLFEVTRLDALARRYYERAMAGEGDTNSGALYVKISERKACMVGMNAPAAAAVQLIHQTAPVTQQTSTEKIRAALDNVMGISVCERELEDKADYSDVPLTADERTELEQLRSAREARRGSN